MPRKKVRKVKGKGKNFPKAYEDEEMVPDLDCTAKQAYNYLNKSWRKFKIGKSKGDEISMSEAQEAINNIQKALKIPETRFDDYEGPVEEEEDE